MTEQAQVSGIAFELGRLCDIAEAADHGVSEADLLELVARGQETFSWFDGPAVDAIQRCVQATLDQTGLEPQTIDGVLVVTECFAGLSDGLPLDAEPAFRVARNLVFDSLSEIGVNRAAIFCTTFGGSSNFVQALVLAKALIETGAYKRLLMLCIDRLPPGESRMMDAALAVTGDGVATCLVSAEPTTGGFLIDYAGVCPYAPSAQSNGLASMVLEMYRATKGAAADCYETMGLQPHDFGGLVLSNYNQTTSRVFARLLGFSAEQTFLKNVIRTGHVPACDPLINLLGLTTESARKAGERLLLYANGPISCGVVALRIMPISRSEAQPQALAEVN